MDVVGWDSETIANDKCELMRGALRDIGRPDLADKLVVVECSSDPGQWAVMVKNALLASEAELRLTHRAAMLVGASRHHYCYRCWATRSRSVMLACPGPWDLDC